MCVLTATYHTHRCCLLVLVAAAQSQLIVPVHHPSIHPFVIVKDIVVVVRVLGG